MKIIFKAIIILSLFISPAIPQGNSPRFDATSIKNKSLNSRELIELVKIGKNLFLDSCHIEGIIALHDTIKQEIRIINSQFLDIVDFSSCVFIEKVIGMLTSKNLLRQPGNPHHK